MRLRDAAALDKVLEDFGGEPVAIRTRSGDLLLVFEDENNGACYQGVPYAEDEDGRKVNRNTGRVADLREPTWPVSLVTPYTKRERAWRDRRLAFETAPREAGKA